MTQAPLQMRLHRQALVALLAGALALVALTFDDYGVTWDEPYHDIYGRHLLAYYTTLFADKSALTYFNLWLYGGAFDLPVAALKTVSPFGGYETAHLANALVGIAGVVGAVRIGELLGGPRAGLAAGALLLITPSWLGHMFFNPKDIPFATGMTWTLYFAMRFMRSFPCVSTRDCCWLGVTLGLTLGMRISGVFALLYLGLALTAWAGVAAARTGWRSAFGDAVRGGFSRLLPAMALAYLVMLSLWPWAQQDPLRRPLMALQIFANSPWDLDVLFRGRLVNSLALPADYLPVYLLVKLPELVLLLLACGAGALAADLRRGGRQRSWRVLAPQVLLAIAVAVPICFFLVFRPVTYDAIRHFLFILPPLSVAAALGLEAVLVRFGSSTAWRAAVAVPAIAYVMWHGSTIARLHPNQYAYYNALVGGIAGAEGRFELDYWGNSYREAVEKLTARLAQEPDPRRADTPYRVLVCSAGTSAAYFFPRHLVLAQNETEADFYIASTRLGCDAEFDGDVFAKVTRDGAVLSVVKDRRGLQDSPERLARRNAGAAPERRHPGLDTAGGGAQQ